MVYVYNADNLEDYINRGSVYSSGYHITLQDGQVIKITWAGVNALLRDSNGLSDASVINGEGSTLNTTKPTPTVTVKPTPASTVEPTPIIKEEFKQKDALTNNSQPTSEAFTLESAITYLLSPDDSTLSVNVINMGEGTFTAMTSAGKTYIGMVEEADDSYVIELMDTSSGGSYDTEKAPYDYKSEGFTKLLNFLVKDDNITIVSIIPMFDTLYAAMASNEDTYMIEVIYSESVIMVGLLSYD